MRKLLGLVSTLSLLVGCGAPIDELETETEAVSEALTAPPPIAIYGAGGVRQLVKIDPASGTYTVLGTIPTATMNSMTLQTSLYVETPARRLYVFGTGNDSVQRLFGINPANAQVVTSPPVARPVDIERNNQGQLVGFCVEGGVTPQFCRVDPLTGVITVMNSNLGSGLGVFIWASAHNPATNLYYVLTSQRIVTINSATGQVVSNQPLSQSDVRTLRINALNQVVGVRWTGSQKQLVTINPATGAVLSGSVIAGMGNATATMVTRNALDRGATRHYQIEPDEWGVNQIFTLNSNTGQLLDVAPLPGSPLSWMHLQIAK